MRVTTKGSHHSPGDPRAALHSPRTEVEFTVEGNVVKLVPAKGVTCGAADRRASARRATVRRRPTRSWHLHEVGDGGTLVDSNVILDVLTRIRGGMRGRPTPGAVARRGITPHHPITMRGLDWRRDIEETEEMLPAESFLRLPIPLEAAFLPESLPAIPKAEGSEDHALAEFFIGAHAAVPDCSYSRGIAGATAPTFLP